MSMRTGTKIPTDVDFTCTENLYHVLKPEFHHMVSGWMLTANDKEKRGIMMLARVAEPTLTRTIGRPSAMGMDPRMNSHSTFFGKQGPADSQGPMRYPVRDRDYMMSRSSSDPSFGPPQHEYVIPSWMHEDGEVIGKIEKPGGYVCALKDNVTIQRMKNSQRNKGTYKLFGGQFDGTTTHATMHSLRAIGQD